MTNPIKALTDFVRTLTDDYKPPLHIGEAMACWTYVAMMDESSIYLQAALNTTQDHDLLASLQDSLNQCQNQTMKLKQFMKEQGIPLPPVSSQKPKSDPSSIPLGVKLTDDEIANGVSAKTISAMLTCASGAAQSIRSDVGMIWIEFLGEKMMYGMTLKKLMIEKGWLKVPPPFTPPGSPHNA